MKVGIVVPHIFMQQDILSQVIFSPAPLALDLCAGLQQLDADVTLFSPGPVDTPVRNITADLSYFERELAGRGDTYLDLLKKHPLTFINLARQVQAELIAKAYDMANKGELDIVHIYTNEEELALPFAALCNKPVVFTHHDPFNFLIKYKNVFPKYADRNWISLSHAQRQGMPADTNWVANIYHGLPPKIFKPSLERQGEYLAYLGRIIEPKGLHLAIAAVKAYNAAHDTHYRLKIAGKHYAGAKDLYWQERIKPALGNDIEYLGFIDNTADKQAFLAGADALLVPSTFEEPFGMVMIESLACGTPIIGLHSGAIPEVTKTGQTGIVVEKVINKNVLDEAATTASLTRAIEQIPSLERAAARADFEARFTTTRMCQEHLAAYKQLIK
jgi:glycosyltransferase involved in cell wall biosynthesis